MNFKVLFAVFAAVFSVGGLALGEGHSGASRALALEVPARLCSASQTMVKNWARDEHQWTAYVSTITSEQAKADCFNITLANQTFAAASTQLKVLAKLRALENCVLNKSNRSDWCVVVGVLRNR